jgi:hypothetical protein
MGEAKRRGTKEQRIEQAIERRKIEAVEREAARLRAIREKHEAVRNLPPEERKTRILGGGSSRLLLTAAAAMALAAPMPTRRRVRGGGA